MKVSIGARIQPGPWGGGNQFAINLTEYLSSRGTQVSHDLKDSDIDLILLTEPRTTSRGSAYGSHEILRYLLLKNPKAVVVHRINECDERKGTHHINRLILSANKIADHTVFVSSWLRNLYVNFGFGTRPHTTILNGANTKLFHPSGHQNWEGIGPLKLVTHHWGGNWLKGFDIYQEVDHLLSRPDYKENISFSYIGQLPKGFQFLNASYHAPLYGEALAECLRGNHVYLTASRNEPGSNHQNEGACCGLPLLYIESGSLPEYCTGFGISFQPENFVQKLNEMIATYPQWSARMVNFPYTAHRMCIEYEQLFLQLLDERNGLINQREWTNQAIYKLSAFLPKKLVSLFFAKAKHLVKRWIK